MSAPSDDPANRLAYLRGFRRGLHSGRFYGLLLGVFFTWGIALFVEATLERVLLTLLVLSLGFAVWAMER